MTIRADKRAFMESVTAEDLAAYLYTKPEEFAVGSEKLEPGKPRSIYGVALMHYIICSYCTKGFEEQMHLVEGFEKGLSGIKEYACQHKKVVAASDDKTECTILFGVVGEIGVQRGYYDDFIKAAAWLSQAKYNMKFSTPLSDAIHFTLQGLFSGTRTTDFHNSCLNHCYFAIAKELVESNYGIKPVDLYHVNQGDDVWISNGSRHWAALMYYTLTNMGFVLSRNKQMLGPNIGEFLRVLYHKGGATGYANRSICNYILRPIQHAKTLDVKAAVTSLYDTYLVLQRRGIGIEMLNTFWL